MIARRKNPADFLLCRGNALYRKWFVRERGRERAGFYVRGVLSFQAGNEGHGIVTGLVEVLYAEVIGFGFEEAMKLEKSESSCQHGAIASRIGKSSYQ